MNEFNKFNTKRNCILDDCDQFNLSIDDNIVPKISVLSYIIQLNLYNLNILDLITIAKYIPINEQITGLQFNYLRNVFIIERGKTNKKNCFYNQLTMYIKLKNSSIKKLKLFNKGKCHICGCKNEDEVSETINILLTNLTNFNINITEPLFPYKNFAITKDNFIISSNNNIIGYIKNINNSQNKNSQQLIYISGERVVFYNLKNKSYLISFKFHQNKYKHIYNTNGEKIGLIDKKYNIIDLNEGNLNDSIEKELISYNFSKKYNNIQLISKEICLLNSYVHLNVCINKKKLFEWLKQRNYHVSYEPLIFHALKLFYYTNKEKNIYEGRCKCDKIKCDCDKSTCIICGNGCLLFYGFKDINTRDTVFKFIKEQLTKIM